MTIEIMGQGWDQTRDPWICRLASVARHVTDCATRPDTNNIQQIDFFHYCICPNKCIVGKKKYLNFIPSFENSVDPDQLASLEAS